jgi:hypothetical protein
MKDSIEFVWEMHMAEVDLRPCKASSRKGQDIINFLKDNSPMELYGLSLSDFKKFIKF